MKSVMLRTAKLSSESNAKSPEVYGDWRNAKNGGAMINTLKSDHNCDIDS